MGDGKTKIDIDRDFPDGTNIYIKENSICPPSNEALTKSSKNEIDIVSQSNSEIESNQDDILNIISHNISKICKSDEMSIERCIDSKCVDSCEESNPDNDVTICIFDIKMETEISRNKSKFDNQTCKGSNSTGLKHIKNASFPK